MARQSIPHRAKQTEPVKRKVALKLIKAGMDTKAVLHRFEQERQALAVFEKLAADFPALPAYRQDQVASHNNLGLLLAGVGKWPEAEEQHRQALAIREKQAEKISDVPEYQLGPEPAFRAARATARINAGRVADAVAEVAELSKTPNWNAAYMRMDPDLQPIRAREDFKKLIAELEKHW